MDAGLVDYDARLPSCGVSPVMSRQLQPSEMAGARDRKLISVISDEIFHPILSLCQRTVCDHLEDVAKQQSQTPQWHMDLKSPPTGVSAHPMDLRRWSSAAPSSQYVENLETSSPCCNGCVLTGLEGYVHVRPGMSYHDWNRDTDERNS